MVTSYLKLAAAALIPVLATAVFYYLQEHTKFGKSKYIPREALYGIVFGFIAIIGTEWGIPIDGAQVNCRDAAVIAAGLFFGAPAGILAGLIGGIERWFAVYWGIGTFTRIACTVSTIIAGFVSALLRKFMFDDKKPGWLISFSTGFVIEVFHMTMVFLTNLSNTGRAMEVIKACTLPMVIGNSLSVLLSALVVSLISKEKSHIFIKGGLRITAIVQRWLILVFIIAFVLSSAFIYRLQTESANNQLERILSAAVTDVTNDIEDSSDRQLISRAHQAVRDMGSKTLNQIALENDAIEVNIVNRKGVITDSTNHEYIGFDMSSGTQSAEFMRLINDVSEYAQPLTAQSYDSNRNRKYVGVSMADGFLQLGFNVAQAQRSIDDEIFTAATNKHIGGYGFMLVFDDEYSLASAPADFDYNILVAFRQVFPSQSDLPEKRQVFNFELEDETYYAWSDETEGYRIITMMTESDAFATRDTAVYVNIFMEVLMFGVLYVMVYFILSKSVIEPLNSTKGSLKKIASGDLDVVVDEKGSEEFSNLSNAINTTVTTLKGYIDEAEKRMEGDLQMAKNIQASALPSVFPAFPQRHDFDVYAQMDPAKEVGGDFYDFYFTGHNTFNFVIADVSGKGIPAAMFMMRAKTQLQGYTKAGKNLDDVFCLSNDALCEGNDAGMFVTGWQGMIDLANGHVQYVNAGHNPPVVRDAATGTFQYLRSRPNLVLAGMEGVPYKLEEYTLQKGDTILLYTDGVTEATNSGNELYGEERLLKCLNSMQYNDMQDLVKQVRVDVDKFVAEAPQFDDITMLAFKYIG